MQHDKQRQRCFTAHGWQKPHTFEAVFFERPSGEGENGETFLQNVSSILYTFFSEHRERLRNGPILYQHIVKNMEVKISV